MGQISITGLGKAYKNYTSRWERLLEWVIPYSKPRHSLKWVLQDINFHVRSGEAVGLVGMNGAGKSTLLKMIAGTTKSTVGDVTITGRIAALLELGIGFHPDFTGRQNVLMSGQLMGFSLDDLNRLMPEIEAFAEIGDYIDQPVRIYSSGMQMRLAFSVATAQRPDVLIVDEALSVGDTYFQHKSFDRIRHYRNQGTTLLLVSHDKGAIQAVCDRAILLNEGKLAMEGEPEAVMDYYNAMLADKENQKIEQKIRSDGKVQTISGSGEATVRDIALLNKNGQVVEVVDVGESVTLAIDVMAHANIPRLVLGYGVKDRLGQVMYGTNTHLTGQVLENVEAGGSYRFNISFSANLGPGNYSVQTALVSSDTHLENNYEWCDLALLFSVVNASRQNFSGCNWLPPTIKIVKS